MEVYKVNSCTEDGIDLISDQQLESLLDKIRDSAEVMVKWKETIPETDNEDEYEELLNEVYRDRKAE